MRDRDLSPNWREKASLTMLWINMLREFDVKNKRLKNPDRINTYINSIRKPSVDAIRAEAEKGKSQLREIDVPQIEHAFSMSVEMAMVKMSDGLFEVSNRLQRTVREITENLETEIERILEQERQSQNSELDYASVPIPDYDRKLFGNFSLRINH